MTHNEPSLPSNHAFVVQFTADADLKKRRVEGRVEHIESGQSLHRFSSWKQLQDFMAQVLSNLKNKP